MASNIELSVVLPAYHEEENLSVILPKLNEVLAATGLVHEVLVVDAHLPADNTGEICRANGARCVNRKNSDFFGDAIRTGIEEAKGTYVIFMDADGSHTPGFIPRLLEQRAEAGVVVASRYIEGGGTDNTPVLIFMSRVLNLIYSVVLNIKCADISNNFKLYRRELLSGLELNCRNFDIVEEILYRIVRGNPGVKILEVPFVFEQRKFGKTKRNLAVFMVSFAVTLFKLRFGIK